MSVPGTKKSCVNLSQACELRRSVITEALLLSRVAACELAALPAPATPLAKKPRASACQPAPAPPPRRLGRCATAEGRDGSRRGGLRGGRSDGARHDDVGPD